MISENDNDFITIAISKIDAARIMYAIPEPNKDFLFGRISIATHAA